MSKCKRHGRLQQQDSLRSWLVCCTATISDSVHLSLSHCFALILPILVEEFNETRENAAWIGSIAYSMTFLLSPLCTLCCKYFGCRKTAVVGNLSCAAGLVISSFSTSFHLLYFSYSILLGAGGSLLHISGILLVQRYFNKKRSLATGVVSTGSSFGAVLGPLYQLLIQRVGWKNTYRMIASCFSVSILLVLLFYSGDVDDGSKESDEESNKESEDKRERKTKNCWPNINFSYWNSAFIIAVVTITIQSLGIYIPLIHLVKYTNEIGLPPQKASMLFIYIGVVSFFGKIIAGRLCDYPGISSFWVNQIAGVISGLSIIFLQFPSDERGFIAFACCYGLGLGSFITSLYLVFLNSVRPMDRPIALATGEVISSLSVLVGPPFIGFIADKLDSYIMAFAVAGGIVIAASLIPFLRICIKSDPLSQDQIHQVLLEEVILIERETVL
ncbi:monocarboxylate transporter 10-like [Actinia tenebrosa]|uniref:Monocarboxylate transporter 10-like n=1 Tax=Actinia tenebrosa TaxID=6105 RepID=A0A6P8HYX3_ACTTE|nr:monocarboxylate transporter 10-like [Actinia tenebrosa]XP_031557860.1 monocarboxylate transporter 10-like [Actinia tenebrosa]